MRKSGPKWYKLDSAGVMYSALQKDEYSAIYRFSAVMHAAVDPAALQRAIDKTMPRFPGFSVRIGKGFFWYYLEPNTAPGPFLKEDVLYPCQPVRFGEDNGWLVRFYYYEKRISVEVFHALSDGAGAMVFFRTLLAVYLRMRGVAVPCGEGILDVNEKPKPHEIEDAYSRYAGKQAARLKIPPKAYQNTGTPEPFYTLHVTMGFVDVDKLKAVAKRSGASLTEYLAAVLLLVIQARQKAEKPLRPKPVSLVVPVNLRPFFPSKTLRNFILTYNIGIDPLLGDYTFDEILHRVRHQLKLCLDRHEMQAVITRNVRFTRNRLLQLVPIALKNPVMAMNYRLIGARSVSGTYSNPGAFTVPDEMRPHIHHMEVVIGQATVARSHCACLSYGNTMAITFAGTQKENDTARDFFRHLVREGLHVKVQSNDVWPPRDGQNHADP